MPVIRISDENWERLKRWAVPLEDSVDDALGKVLNAAESLGGHPQQVYPNGDGNEFGETDSDKSVGRPTRARRRRKGQKVPQSEYERPILESLDKLGGKASATDVLNEVERRMKDLFGTVDYEFPKTATEERWRNTARWARAALIQRGLIKGKGDSEWGVWELTPRGVAEARKGKR